VNRNSFVGLFLAVVGTAISSWAQTPRIIAVVRVICLTANQAA
jgi:hypothetical protein